MRRAIIVGRRHGAKTLVVLSGPAVGYAEQRELFKRCKASREHRDLAEIQLWDSSSGCIGRLRLGRTKADPEPLFAEPEAAAMDVALVARLSTLDSENTALRLEAAAAHARIAELERAAKNAARATPDPGPLPPPASAPAAVPQPSEAAGGMGPINLDDGPALDLLEKSAGGAPGRGRGRG